MKIGLITLSLSTFHFLSFQLLSFLTARHLPSLARFQLSRLSAAFERTGIVFSFYFYRRRGAFHWYWWWSGASDVDWYGGDLRYFAPFWFRRHWWYVIVYFLLSWDTLMILPRIHDFRLFDELLLESYIYIMDLPLVMATSKGVDAMPHHFMLPTKNRSRSHAHAKYAGCTRRRKGLSFICAPHERCSPSRRSAELPSPFELTLMQTWCLLTHLLPCGYIFLRCRHSLPIL